MLRLTLSHTLCPCREPLESWCRACYGQGGAAVHQPQVHLPTWYVPPRSCTCETLCPSTVSTSPLLAAVACSREQAPRTMR